MEFGAAVGAVVASEPLESMVLTDLLDCSQAQEIMEMACVPVHQTLHKMYSLNPNEET